MAAVAAAEVKLRSHTQKITPPIKLPSSGTSRRSAISSARNATLASPAASLACRGSLNTMWRRYTLMTTFPLAWCPSMWATAFAASLSG